MTNGMSFSASKTGPLSAYNFGTGQKETFASGEHCLLYLPDERTLQFVDSARAKRAYIACRVRGESKEHAFSAAEEAERALDEELKIWLDDGN